MLGALREFHTAEVFIETSIRLISEIGGNDGKIDYRSLEVTLGGEAKDRDYFVRELAFARSALALRRKALIASAAGVALAEPNNPYAHFRAYLDQQANELIDAQTRESELTKQLAKVELKGRWFTRNKSLAEREKQMRIDVLPPPEAEGAPVQFLALPSGEIHQLVPRDGDEESEALEEAPHG